MTSILSLRISILLLFVFLFLVSKHLISFFNNNGFFHTLGNVKMDDNSESPRKPSLSNSNSKSELTSAERRNRASRRSYSRSRRDRSSSSSSSSSSLPSSSSSRRPYFTDPSREKERVLKSQQNSDKISRRMKRQERFRKYRLEKREHRPATAARSYHRSESHDGSGNRSRRTHSRSPPSHETSSSTSRTPKQPQIIIVPVSNSSILF